MEYFVTSLTLIILTRHFGQSVSILLGGYSSVPTYEGNSSGRRHSARDVELARFQRMASGPNAYPRPTP